MGLLFNARLETLLRQETIATLNPGDESTAAIVAWKDRAYALAKNNKSIIIVEKLGDIGFSERSSCVSTKICQHRLLRPHKEKKDA